VPGRSNNLGLLGMPFRHDSSRDLFGDGRSQPRCTGYVPTVVRATATDMKEVYRIKPHLQDLARGNQMNPGVNYKVGNAHPPLLSTFQQAKIMVQTIFAKDITLLRLGRAICLQLTDDQSFTRMLE